MKNKNLLIIFTRNPELGKVKTRLAKTIGETSALRVYEHLLEHTKTITKNVECDKAVYYSVQIREHDIWDSKIYQKHTQKGDDLGKRMLHAFTQAFDDNYEKVMIIGSDLFHLNQNHIKLAFNKLDNHDVVIGPAQDGGYYLLGMNSLYSQVFKNKAWSTSSVLKDTLNDLKEHTIFKTETLNDIDVYDDLKDITELTALIEK